MQPPLKNSGTISGPRFIAYIRLSTDAQANDGVSRDEQRARIKAYAAAAGGTIVGVYEDVASGGIEPRHRPGLVAARNQVLRDEADAILVTKLDRLSRSTVDLLAIYDASRRGKCPIVSVAEHIDTRSAAGEFFFTMLAGLAQMERGVIRERTVLAMNEIARQGRARSRFLPFGLRVSGEPDRTTVAAGDRRKLVPHAGEQQILSRIQRLQKTRGSRTVGDREPAERGQAVEPAHPTRVERGRCALHRKPSATGVRLTPSPLPRLAARNDVRAEREVGRAAGDALDGGRGARGAA
jgi:site-specific DNA recombinase